MASAAAAAIDEDDYMSMAFAEPEASKHETSAQRRIRKQREVNPTLCPPTFSQNVSSVPTWDSG